MVAHIASAEQDVQSDASTITFHEPSLAQSTHFAGRHESGFVGRVVPIRALLFGESRWEGQELPAHSTAKDQCTAHIQNRCERFLLSQQSGEIKCCMFVHSRA